MYLDLSDLRAGMKVSMRLSGDAERVSGVIASSGRRLFFCHNKRRYDGSRIDSSYMPEGYSYSWILTSGNSDYRDILTESKFVLGQSYTNKNTEMGVRFIVGVDTQNNYVFFTNDAYRKGAGEDYGYIYRARPDEFESWTTSVTKEMTVAEISRKLGYDVKVVK